MNKRVGKEMFAMRREAGYTIAEVAAAVGTTPYWVTMAERGDRSPDFAYVARLCQFLGASADRLVAAFISE